MCEHVLAEHAILREYEGLLELQAEELDADLRTEVSYHMDLVQRVFCPVCQQGEVQLVDGCLACPCGLNIPAQGAVCTPAGLESFVLQTLDSHRYVSPPSNGRVACPPRHGASRMTDAREVYCSRCSHC